MLPAVCLSWGAAKPKPGRGVSFPMRTEMLRSRWLLTVFMATGFSLTTTAGVGVNPYEWIVERNPFALRPPPVVDPTPVAPVVPAPPLATVEVTGITSILSTPRALLEIVPGPGKPMLKPILGVGERVDAVEVISISMEKGLVMLRNGSVVTNVSLKAAGSGISGPPVHTPALNGNPAAGIAGIGASPDMAPASVRRSVALGGGVMMPERTLRVPRLPPIPQPNRGALPPGANVP